MSDNRVFLATLAIILGGIVYEAFVLIATRRANLRATLLPASLWWVNAAIELAMPLGSLVVLQLFSPRGEIAALSVPAILRYQ